MRVFGFQASCGVSLVSFLSPRWVWVGFHFSTHSLRPFDKLRASCGCILSPLCGWTLSVRALSRPILVKIAQNFCPFVFAFF